MRIFHPRPVAVKYSMTDSEDEFDDCWKSRAPTRRAVVSDDDDDDDSYLPNAGPAADSDPDSPAPPPKSLAPP